MYVTAISQANTTILNVVPNTALSRELTFDSITISRTFSLTKMKPAIEDLFLAWKRLHKKQSMFSIRTIENDGISRAKKFRITKSMDLEQLLVRVENQITRMSSDISEIKTVQLEIENRKKPAEKVVELASTNRQQISLFTNLDTIRSKFGIDNLIGKSTLHELAQNPLSLAS